MADEEVKFEMVEEIQAIALSFAYKAIKTKKDDESL